MPHTLSKTVYKFDELDNSAKENARQWFRESSAGDNDTDFIYEDAATCGDILGIDLRTRSVKLMGGGTRLEPCIYYSGFSSQGDGACFEGSYAYAKGGAKKIREHAPQDAELHRIADTLQKIQSENFYRLTATTKHRGHYYHSGCMDVNIDDSEVRVDSGAWLAIEETVTQCLRDFADWIYRQLEADYEWSNADEQVDENIRANEYDFTETGRIA